MARRGPRGGAAIIHDDIGFDLDRLFDHHNMDHIPVAQRLDGFKHRNLPHVKHYKAAVNIFGGPISRKRIIIAPPMETPLKRKLGLYMNQREDPPPPVLNSPLKPSQGLTRVLSSSEVLDQEEKEKESSYKKWYTQRQALRGNLDGIGLNEAFLERKADKSELEKRVQTQLRAARLWKPESPPPPEPVPEEKEPPVVPSVQIPVPSALQTLDKFLTEKKIRLVDLFRNADRNNDWKLTKEELLAAVKKYEIPLTGPDVEDLMVALDRNFDEHLDFKEMSQGLAALKAERRTTKRQGSSSLRPVASQPSPLSKISPMSRDQLNSNQNSQTGRMSPQKGQGQGDQPQSREAPVDYTADDLGEVEIPQTEKPGETGSTSGSQSRSGSGHRSRSTTPNSLEPPHADVRGERRPASSCEEMVELRKHDKAVLERAKSKKWPWPESKGSKGQMPGVIRIGHKDVDNHCMESTLEGEVGQLLDQFRRNCLREYFHAIRICQEKGLVLSPELLDRVLLYPAELPRDECKKKLAVPKGPLADIDSQFAKPPKKPKTPPEIRHKDKMKRSKNGTLMIDVRHMYPPSNKVAAVATKENLSTGRALVARKSQCWMTFEEYDKFTKHLPRRYKKLNIKTRPDSEQTSSITGYTRSPAASSHLAGKDPDVLDLEGVPPSLADMLQKHGMGQQRYELDSEKFWPGYMLDKLALFEPSWDSGGWAEGGQAVFHNTRQPKRGNTGHFRVTGPVVNSNGTIIRYGIDAHRQLLAPIDRLRKN